MSNPTSNEVIVPRWLLEQIQTELRHCYVFVTSRQKLHPVGVEQYEQLQQHVLAYLSMPPDSRLAAETSDDLTFTFPRAWAPYLQAVILGATGDMDGDGDCRWHLSELAKKLGEATP